MVSVLQVVFPSVEVLPGVEVLLPGVEVQYICYRTTESEWSSELVSLAFVSFSLNLGTDGGSASHFIASVPGRRFLPRPLCLLQEAGIPAFLRRQTGFLC